MRINPRLVEVQCSRTGLAVPENEFATPLQRCGCCRVPSPVVVRYAAQPPPNFIDVPGLWRYADFLPVIDVPADYAADVGRTPCFPLPFWSEELDVDLWVKTEAGNPSGSFKDRGLAAGIALGATCGARQFCLPTQGNAGVAASLFSRRLGLEPCLVYMPDGYQGGYYHRAASHFGARVSFHGPTLREAGQRMREELTTPLGRGEVVDISTFFEPGRLEGKKTMGLEIFEDFGPDPLPDAILYPTGGGTGLVGIWKAFEELVAVGLLDPARLPRLVAVQSSACAPVVEAFERGLAVVEPVTSAGTVAVGLDVSAAIMGHEILRALRASKGHAVTVPEERIRPAFAELAARGVTASYEGAALLEALRLLRSDDRVTGGSRVLLLNTASHLTALDT